MNDFILDLWQDLRERRLLPVAIGLAVALLALPLLVLKSGPSGSSAAPAPMTASSEVPSVPPLRDTALADASKLEELKEKNPFRPLESLEGVTTSEVDAGSPPATASGASDAPSGVAGSTGGGESESDPGTGGKEDSSAGKTPAPGTPSVPKSAPRDKPKEKLKATVDILFGRVGEETIRRGVDQMTVLPSSRRPLVVFLGVTGDRKAAVFLVNLEQQLTLRGEGTCRPSPRRCSLLYLRLDRRRNGEFFSDGNATEYHLRLLRIGLAPISSASAALSLGPGAPALGTATDEVPAGFPLLAGVGF